MDKTVRIRVETMPQVVVEVEPEALLEPAGPPEYVGTSEETVRAVQLAALRQRLGLPARAGRNRR